MCSVAVHTYQCTYVLVDERTYDEPSFTSNPFHRSSSLRRFLVFLHSRDPLPPPPRHHHPRSASPLLTPPLRLSRHTTSETPSGRGDSAYRTLRSHYARTQGALSTGARPGNLSEPTDSPSLILPPFIPLYHHCATPHIHVAI